MSKEMAVNNLHCCIGIDVGGTKIAGGLVVFPKGEVLDFQTVWTESILGSEAVLARVEKLITDLSSAADARNLQVKGTGLAVCELVDREGNLQSAHTIAWNRDQLLQKFGRFGKVAVEADVRAAGRSEAMFGAGQGSKCFLYVTVGTGISSCLVINGEPYLGSRGATGTIASGPMPRVVLPNETEAPVTLEDFASGKGILNEYRNQGGEAASAQEILEAAEAGNERAIKVIRLAGQGIGGTIGWLINVLDPQKVILGGGLGLTEGIFRQAIIRAVRRHTWWKGHMNIPITSAVTGKQAALIGAAALV